jgi:hypothetical protein
LDKVAEVLLERSLVAILVPDGPEEKGKLPVVIKIPGERWGWTGWTGEVGTHEVHHGTTKLRALCASGHATGEIENLPANSDLDTEPDGGFGGGSSEVLARASAAENESI